MTFHAIFMYKKKQEQDLLVLDFSIKQYKVCSDGWKTVDFPTNIILNDKLYLDEKLQNQLITILDGFIKNGYLSMAEDKTPRGFGYIKLRDTESNIISIQESSAAGDHKIWLGCEVNRYLGDNNKEKCFDFNTRDFLIEDRLHLNKEGVRNLIQAMKYEWINHKVAILDKNLEKKPVNSLKNKI